MSNDNPQPKIYVPKTSAKEITFQDGGSIIKLGIHAETVAAFLLEHKNEKGYVNINICKRKAASQFGDTHYAVLDTWKPTPRQATTQATAQEQGPEPEATAPY